MGGGNDGGKDGREGGNTEGMNDVGREGAGKSVKQVTVISLGGMTRDEAHAELKEAREREREMDYGGAQTQAHN